MFLHIGAEKEVLAKDIVAIINISSVKKSKITKEFLRLSAEEGFTRRISEDVVKSIVIANENGKYIQYYSPINSLTLQNRLQFLNNI